jgi:hypothetical protein
MPLLHTRLAERVSARELHERLVREAHRALHFIRNGQLALR